MPSEPPAIPSSIRLAVGLRARVRELAARDGAPPMHSWRRRSLPFVEREEQREALRQDKAAHEQYLRTGVHVTQAEVKDRISRLPKDCGAVPPACHIYAQDSFLAKR